MSNYKRKYKMGGIITSLDELAKQEFVYECHTVPRLVHCGWFLSYQFRYAICLLKRGSLYYAIKNEENTDDQQ